MLQRDYSRHHKRRLIQDEKPREIVNRELKNIEQTSCTSTLSLWKALTLHLIWYSLLLTIHRLVLQNRWNQRWKSLNITVDLFISNQQLSKTLWSKPPKWLQTTRPIGSM
jgi:hypothetical protein